MTSSVASSWSVWAFLIGGVIVGLIGLALFIRALIGDRARGRRRCPRCWYDLSQTQGLRCSECGHETKRERQLFRTRRRWRMAAVAVLLMLVAGGGLGWQQTRNFDWNTVKPVWWLLAEADGPSQRAINARKEFVRRLQTSELSDEQLNRVVAKALAIQADSNAYWSGRQWGDGWGDVVEEAWNQERLTEEQIQTYARQAFESALFVEVRAKIRQGAKLPARIGGREPRLSNRFALGADTQLLARANCTLPPGIESPSRGGRREFERVMVGVAGSPGGWANPHFSTDLSVGRHELEFGFDAFTKFEPRDPIARAEAAALDPLVRWTAQRGVVVEVVAPDEPTVRLIADAALQHQIREAIQLEFIESRLEIGTTRFGGQNGMILVKPVPVNLSFDVFARVGGEEHPIGAIAVEANQSRTDNARRIETHPATLFPDAAAFDLILRALPAGAEQTVDIFEAWDGEIVIEDVPLKRADSADSG